MEKVYLNAQSNFHWLLVQNNFPWLLDSIIVPLLGEIKGHCKPGANLQNNEE